ncbi:rod shape-determining protein MreC [soil metagenome]
MSRINVIALVAFVGLLVWVLTFDNAATQKIQSTVLSIFAPMQKAGDDIERAVLDLGKPEKSLQEYAEENSDLLIEVKALRIQAQEIDQLKEENDTFRKMLKFRENAPLRLIPARVVGRSAGTWWNTVTIDKGYRQHISVDSPVVTDRGLVGKTALVNSEEATVILLTDERCQVAARITGTPDLGILMGARGATRVTPDLRLRFLSKDADPEPGAAVFTTNSGGLFPAGIMLGEVKQFATKDIYGEATVRPAVDFNDLQFVFVIEREDLVIEVGGDPVSPDDLPPSAGYQEGGR